MKYFRIMVISAGLLVPTLVHAQSSLPIFQHLGANDPTAEGFNLVLGSGGSVGAVGTSAWTTAVGSPNGNTYYQQTFSLQQLADMAGQNWVLSFTVQVAQSGNFPNSYLQLETGSATFILPLGSDSNGDPFINGSSLSPMFVLNGGGSGYHNYQLIYNTANATANLWVDGTDAINNYPYATHSGAGSIAWGEGQAGSSQGNWSLVSLSVVPEPSTLSLLTLGGLLLGWRWRKTSRA